MSNVESLEESCSKERSSSIKDGYDNMYWRMLVVLISTSTFSVPPCELVIQAVDGQEPPEPCKDNVQATT
ncbi:hypothetical protein TRIUR3_27416 [Triticum urartu]|uniref:Uncharacterized protein n=1 Tax=Triticum urartu TaxID=4572 RepID=M8ADT3_TRIUA|nr:hypothetical protein TRIUR3_27416 [Triticum urartu]